MRRPASPRPGGATPVQIDATTIPLTASIGAAIAGDTLRTPDELVDAADHALYEAKRAGRNCVRVYDPVATGDLTAGPR